MHPLKLTDLQPDFLAKKPILLLNTAILPIHSLVCYIIVDALPGAASKLPTEIWLHIIEYAKKDAKHEAVQPTSIAQSNHGTILHCQAVELDLGEFADRAEVEAAEQWLQSPHTYDQQRGSEDVFAAKVVTNRTHAILFPSSASASPGAFVPPALSVPDCLFTAITVPDVISWLQNGRCWICNGDRDICPGCTGGKAQWLDAFMGCGELLACPLCMGLEFMDVDKAFLQKYYWDGLPPHEKAARDARLHARWAELGYLEN
ncbi:MAG: hypothetical protein Q9184_005266 [Pyrenodesmia sp. 2 TL-2023]